MAWLVEDAPRKSVLIPSIAKVSIFLRNMLEKFPQYRHFTREMPVSENALLLFLTRFLVDPLPVLESPWNFRVKWTSPNSGLELWYGFCHLKIISYQNVHANMSFYPSNCREDLLFLIFIRSVRQSTLRLSQQSWDRISLSQSNQ